MSWFKVSDGISFHQKILRAGNEAVGAWVRAGAWSSAPDNLTDGYIPPEVATSIAPPRVWAKLRSAGLTEAPTDGRQGEQIHDFLDYNPSAEAAASRREARVNAGRAGGVRSGQTRSKREASASTVASTETNPARALPVPSRPDPVPDPPVCPPPGDATRAEEPSAGPDPDLLALAQTLAAEGNGLGKSVVERGAQGRLPTPNQRDALRKIRDERAEAAKPLPPAPDAPRPRAREPTRAEVERMLADAERDTSTMSPALPEPNGARVDVVGMLAGRR